MFPTPTGFGCSTVVMAVLICIVEAQPPYLQLLDYHNCSTVGQGANKRLELSQLPVKIGIAREIEDNSLLSFIIINTDLSPNAFCFVHLLQNLCATRRLLLHG